MTQLLKNGALKCLDGYKNNGLDKLGDSGNEKLELLYYKMAS